MINIFSKKARQLDKERKAQAAQEIATSLGIPPLTILYCERCGLKINGGIVGHNLFENKGYDKYTGEKLPSIYLIMADYRCPKCNRFEAQWYSTEENLWANYEHFLNNNWLRSN